MSDNIYSRNIEAMRSRFADVIEFMEQPSDDIKMINEDREISVDVTEVDGKKILVVQKGDKVYRLDSLYDSERMLDLWFDGLKEKWDLNARLYMYGLGNGMYVRKFLEKARKDCLVVVFEPSYKIFRTVLENFDLTDILTNLRVRFIFWPLEMDKGVKLTYQGIMTYTDMYTLAGSVYLNYADLFPKDYTSYVGGVERAREVVSANQQVNNFFGEYFSKNVFSNMHLLENSYDIAKLAKLVPNNIPAIVVSAGPSLDKNIKELHRAVGKFLIVSTDTALKPLALEGITPDISAIMDSKKDERYLSEESSRRVPIVCTPRGGTEFLHLHSGKKFFINDFCDHIGKFMKDNGHELIGLDTGGSVANACFAIAQLFGCKKIILVGQDLAYTGDKTHSAVTVRGAKNTPVGELEHVEMDIDIYGNPIRSSREFKLYKEWFEQQIRADKELEVIDATEGGIRIEGTKLMTLKDAIDKYCTTDFDFFKLTDQAELIFDNDLKEKYRKFVKLVPNQLSEIKRLIRASIADYSEMRRMVQKDDYHNAKMKTLFNRCEKRTKSIEDSPVIEYVHTQLKEKSTELLDKVNRLETDERQELLTVCDLGEQYLKDMDQAVAKLESYMDIIRKDFN
ncbi:MAG: motility associated factor glycosyltransferase family protein [Lachnospiraceae bacterium]|nr:motility associated factor glycosyltransferase family protein [Lachnospiraceae bacterium]